MTRLNGAVGILNKAVTSLSKGDITQPKHVQFAETKDTLQTLLEISSTLS